MASASGGAATDAALDSAAMAALKEHPTILHIDLDCFYAQVEMRRLGIGHDTPFVVNQWGNLIAVNYAARAYGIGRFDSLATATQKCMPVQSCHVMTYANGEREPKYRGAGAITKDTHKVCLEPYRVASRNIFDVFASIDPSIVIEKAGIDEAFLDVTALADRRAASLPPGVIEEHPLEPPQDRSWLYEVARTAQDGAAGDADGDSAPADARDHPAVVRRFRAAGQICRELRRAVRERLGFNCSGGIARNHTLAKFISATNKPNKQSLLLPADSAAFLAPIDFQKLRGFGGKFGRQLAERFGATTVADMRAVSLAELADVMGGRDAAVGVYATLRGQGDTKLTERTAPKSLLAQKNFAPAVNEAKGLRRWIDVLVTELVARMWVVEEEFRVRPHNLNVKLTGSGLRHSGLRGQGDLLNKSAPMPPWPPDETQTADVVESVCATFLRGAAASSPDGRAPMVNCILLGATVLKPVTEATDGAGGTAPHAKQQPGLRAWLTKAKPLAASPHNKVDSDDDVEIVAPQARTTGGGGDAPGHKRPRAAPTATDTRRPARRAVVDVIELSDDASTSDDVEVLP